MKTKEPLKTLDQQAAYVRKGGDLRVFKPAEIVRLQEFALDIKDVRLYDYLEKFWRMV